MTQGTGVRLVHHVKILLGQNPAYLVDMASVTRNEPKSRIAKMVQNEQNDANRA
jgi:hypothetical protein